MAAAVICSKVCACVPVQISQLSAPMRTVQLSGSIGAWRGKARVFGGHELLGRGEHAGRVPGVAASLPSVPAAAEIADAALSSVAPTPGPVDLQRLAALLCGPE